MLKEITINELRETINFQRELLNQADKVNNDLLELVSLLISKLDKEEIKENGKQKKTS